VGFPYWDESLGVLGKMTPKSSNKRKTLAGNALTYAKLRLLSNFACIISICFACAGTQENKGRKKSQKKCIFYVCLERPLAGGFQPDFVNMFVSRTLSSLNKFIVITSEISEL